MEFLILLMSIILAVAFTSAIAFLVHDTWAQVNKAFKDETLMIFIVFMTFMLAFIFAISMFAFNNTFWHIDYWTTEGLWKK